MKEKNPLAVEIGKRIADCRKSLNLTQEQLEERSGVSQNHISSLERGVSLIGADALTRLAPALNVSIDYLLTGNQKTSLSPQLDYLFRWAGQQNEEVQEKVIRILGDIRDIMNL